MKDKSRVMGLVMAAVGAVSVSPSALASSDMGSCPWGAGGCVIATPPILSTGNDTRDNLLRLLGEKRRFTLPVQSASVDVAHSRDYYFAPHITEWYTWQGSDAAQTVTVPALLISIPAQKLGVQTAAIDDFAKRAGGEERFVSNSLSSVEQYYSALLADDALTAEQRTALANARLEVNGSAEAQTALEALSFPADSAAALFQRYLLAANQFYGGNYAAAGEIFTALSQSPQPWLAETAAYMLMRTELNRSSASASGLYGDFEVKNVDKAAAGAALSRAQSYLQTWPEGLYAESVRGMLRRISWYLEDWDRLAGSAEQALMQADTIGGLTSLVAETDDKLLSKDLTRNEAYFLSAPDAPLLTFIQTLRLMRSSECGEATPCVDEPYLAGIKPLFEKAGMLPMWHYLTLTRAEQQQDYAAVLAAIKPADALPENDILAFSRQAMYGRVLMEQKNWETARRHWSHLLTLSRDIEQQQYLQAMLAATQVYSGRPELIFAPDSQVTNLRYRARVLKTLASPERLRQQVKADTGREEKTIALHTLLMKALISGRYGDWLQDKALGRYISSPVVDPAFADVDLSVFDWTGEEAGPGYRCASLEKTVAALNERPDDSHALICLGEFFRTTSASVQTDVEGEGNLALDAAVGSAPSDGTPDRQAYYQRIIANPAAEPEDRSYALYRAVMCYAPSGYNDCGGESVAPAVRRAWFNTLKADYRGGVWAQQLKYYW